MSSSSTHAQFLFENFALYKFISAASTALLRVILFAVIVDIPIDIVTKSDTGDFLPHHKGSYTIIR